MYCRHGAICFIFYVLHTMSSIKLNKPTYRNDVWWDRYEIPTIGLALILYAALLSLVWWHDAIPGVVLFILGGYIGQLHFSLQHESIHAMRHLPKWLRIALVWPPINLWLPYRMYNEGHSKHHVNYHLTHPVRDTESAYHTASHWAQYTPVWRFIFAANQTLFVRMAFGPFLRLYKLVKVEAARIRRGDFSYLKTWAAHLISVAVVLYFVLYIAGMQLWEYLFYCVYPSMMLGMMRTFTEHRYGATPHVRVAIVESNVVFGVLYLYNNLHHVHHLFPTMPWYHIAPYFRKNRAALLAGNGYFYYRGYGEIARKFFFKPVFYPVHPVW